MVLMQQEDTTGNIFNFSSPMNKIYKKKKDNETNPCFYNVPLKFNNHPCFFVLKGKYFSCFII